MIEEATADCYNDDEATCAFACVIETYLKMPFVTTVLGGDVEVIGIDQDESGHIVATCKKGRVKQRIPLLDLPLPSPAPAGVEWIEAYRAWLRGDY